MYKTINRGEIYLADFNPSDKTGKPVIHRVIVLQTSTDTSAQRALVVALITSRDKTPNPTRVDLGGAGFLQKPAIALLDNLWTIDKKRFRKRLGILHGSHINKIDKALAISIGLERNHETPLEMTLCPKCLASFEDAGEFSVWRKNKAQRNRRPCTFCDGYRTGYDYQILRRTGVDDDCRNPA
jgi:mRNA interferase MazF